ncbi:DNA-binding transcriptional regulator, LysR family [Faunimonas pinastri]|uniref:DNA-binding transcriptional regulator, LysR family n=1 Tax=Faunimonas pinastri TaxID=1855383 RepID=A0A1H9LDP4_9HYPH|nr:LysR substrate-binding domain-containing protein [Faunimonas pinastri]SER09524.1 DNA-binding transcriptional regulator, LysR family [Faunimonas pinastri]
MRFDLPDLRLFLAAVDAGSVTHGAKAANLSLAAASERLRDMEIASGVPLLVRNRRGVVPTRAGDILAHHARLVLRQVGAMHAELTDHAKGFRGSVRMLANSAAIAGFLPARLGPFLARHPGADIDLAERPSPEIVKAVAGGLAEIGIVSDAADTNAVATRPFAVDRLVLVVARDHPLAGEKRVAFAQIAAEPMIGFDGALQVQIRDQGERIGIRVRPRILLRTFEGVCRMVADGAGVGIVPELSARRARRSMPLDLLRLTDPWATRQLMLCSMDHERLEPLALSLLQHLVSDEDGGWPSFREGEK